MARPSPALFGWWVEPPPSVASSLGQGQGSGDRRNRGKRRDDRRRGHDIHGRRRRPIQRGGDRRGPDGQATHRNRRRRQPGRHGDTDRNSHDGGIGGRDRDHRIGRLRGVEGDGQRPGGPLHHGQRTRREREHLRRLRRHRHGRLLTDGAQGRRHLRGTRGQGRDREDGLRLVGRDGHRLRGGNLEYGRLVHGEREIRRTALGRVEGDGQGANGPDDEGLTRRLEVHQCHHWWHDIDGGFRQ